MNDRDILNKQDKDTLKEKELLTYDGPDRVVSSVEFWDLIKSRPKVHPHATGLATLDQAIGGFIPGEVIVISGPTAMGKTTLCETILRNLCEQQKTAIFFTFEVTPENIVEKHKDPANVIYLPLEHKPKDLNWLRDRVWEAKLKHPYGFTAVFIDHLHYILDMAAKQNMSLEVGATMRFLKREIALDLRVPVFLVCHVAKIPFGEKPSMNHLRDSSFVAQEADTVLMICRKNDRDMNGKPFNFMSLDQGLATLTIEKARRTGTMGREIDLYKDGSVLREFKTE